jgi:cell division protein FtsZ
VEAAQQAISSPLLEEVSIQGARAILINITGGSDLALHDVSDATQTIYDAAGEEAEVIFGAVIDPNLSDEIRVTVIATGFSRGAAQATAPMARTVQPAAPFLRMAETPRAAIHEMRTVPVIMKPQDISVRKLTRDVNGRVEPVVVGDEPFDERAGLELPTFLRRQMD